MLEKGRDRAKNLKREWSTINLLQFMDYYNPATDRLGVLSGERLHFYKRDCLKYKKKIKMRKKEISQMDKNKLNKIYLRQEQEQLLNEKDAKSKKRFGIGYAPSLLSLRNVSNTSVLRKKWAKTKKRVKKLTLSKISVKDVKLNANIDALMHRKKLMDSPLINKLWFNLSNFFPNKQMYLKVKQEMGFSPKPMRTGAKADIQLDDYTKVIKLLEGTYYMKHLNPTTLEFIQPILEKVSLKDTSLESTVEKYKNMMDLKRKIKNRREKKHIHKKPYIPSKIHCWVLVREGSRNIMEPFFIDVFTGAYYDVLDKNYLKISCVWNDKNYHIPRYVATNHEKVTT